MHPNLKEFSTSDQLMLNRYGLNIFIMLLTINKITTSLLKIMSLSIVIRTMRNVGCNTLNVCQGPKGGLEEPPRAPGDPPTPIHEKTLVSRNDF